MTRKAMEGEMKLISTPGASNVSVRATSDDTIIEEGKDNLAGLLDGEVGLPWAPTNVVLVILLQGASPEVTPTYAAMAHIPPDHGHYPFDADPTCPPSLEKFITAEVKWDWNFFDGHSFRSKKALEAYRHALCALRSDPQVIRVVDGNLGPSWRHEDGARYSYYRAPSDFIMSLCDVFQLEADMQKAVASLRELAEADTVSKDAYDRFPRKVAQREGPNGIVAPFRRLRYTKEGGIICEGYRYGVATGESLRTDVWADSLALLVDRLVSRGAVRYREDRKPPAVRKITINEG